MTKCKVFILTLVTGMFCLGIPLTAVLSAWSVTGKKIILLEERTDTSQKNED